MKVNRICFVLFVQNTYYVVNKPKPLLHFNILKRLIIFPSLRFRLELVHYECYQESNTNWNSSRCVIILTRLRINKYIISRGYKWLQEVLKLNLRSWCVDKKKVFIKGSTRSFINPSLRNYTSIIVLCYIWGIGGLT